MYAGYTNHLFIYEGEGNIGAEQVRELTETHVKVTGRTPVVMIDYLQTLAPYEPKAAARQNTDRAVFELKRLSRDLKIPVIALSTLEESSAVKYSSDVLMGLKCEALSDKINTYPRKIEVKILKSRNGAADRSAAFDYYPMYNYFCELGF
jgi:replicative DNA helicase